MPAIARFTASSESSALPISRPFLKALRESPRPLVAVALGGSDPAMHLPIFEFSIALSSSVIHGADAAGIEKLGASSPPLGTTLPRDFPPRFCHMLVVNGRPPLWLWASPDVFRMLPDLQQSVATFRDRLDDSFQSFDERIVLHADDGATYPMRMQWHGVSPGAGMAELVDSKQVGHTLLLLSGREPEADEALIQSLERTVPSFLMGHSGESQRTTHGIASCPSQLPVAQCTPKHLTDLRMSPIGRMRPESGTQHVGHFQVAWLPTICEAEDAPHRKRQRVPRLP
jgi:hypothetical protein